MATLVADRELDLAGFRKHLASCLPSYARPVFLRIRGQVDLTGTFKYSKTELVRQGYDPDGLRRRALFRQQEERSFRSIRICTSEFRAESFDCSSWR
jgi:fatty-acyl-CoA synthase